MHSPCIAVLPEDMSQERFDWLHKIGAEVVKTPGGESNVKEVFDMNNKLVKEGKGKVQSFNQFSDFSNPIFHYWCTGRAIEKVFESQKKPNQRLAGIHLTQGSAGAISGASEYLRKKYPLIKVAAGEALQCPTLYQNGFGDHRIEGIGDKHVPWVFNVKNLDMVIALDDNDVMDVMHLFNHPEGIKYLKEKGVPEDFIHKLPLLGISGIANMLGCIKEAKLYEFNENDVMMSVCTDSMDMYQSRIKEHKGEYTRDEAVATYAKSLMGLNIDHCLELTYVIKKRCHNLKYFTWKEQQGKSAEELNAQWYDENYWKQYLDESVVDKYDKWIMDFNHKTGLAEKYGMK
jgi:threonine dehydratase